MRNVLLMIAALFGVVEAAPYHVKGELGEVAFEAGESLEELQEEIATTFGIAPSDQNIYFSRTEPQKDKIDFYVAAQPSNRGYNNAIEEIPRDFNAVPTELEVKDIRYILINLADRGLLELNRMSDDLKKAGDRINHVHPLRFLEVVFTNDDLTVAIHNIGKGRLLTNKVWNDFIDGLSGSLQEEKDRSNLTPQQLAEFARAVEVDRKYIDPFAQKNQWENLVKSLIRHVKRKGNHSRYNM